MKLTAAIRRERALYVAQCLEVDVASQGDSEDMALANLREALELYFEDAPAADVSPAVVRTIDVAIAS
jgi:predicted RNase H-like HicB family nuclease